MSHPLPVPFSKVSRTVLRLVVAVGGGYGLCASWVTLLSVALPRMTGLAQSEAVVLSAMLGYELYLCVLLWAFSVRRVRQLCALLLGGTVLALGLTLLAR